MDTITSEPVVKNRIEALPQEIRDKIFGHLLPATIDIRLRSIPITQSKRGTMVTASRGEDTHRDLTTLPSTSRRCREDALGGLRLQTSLRFIFAGEPTTIGSGLSGSQEPRLLPRVILQHLRKLQVIDTYILQPKFLEGSMLIRGGFTRLRSVTSVKIKLNGGISFIVGVAELRSNYTAVPVTFPGEGFIVWWNLRHRMGAAAKALHATLNFTPQVLERLRQVFVYQRKELTWLDPADREAKKALLSRTQGHKIMGYWYMASREPDPAARLAQAKRLAGTDDDQILAHLNLT
ncbi:hypothetical protein LTR85_009046 [Meristemomyces frigidus]|nr:hypothetical protein LTR85_009046 [Meristemomyces frigidus]